MHDSTGVYVKGKEDPLFDYMWDPKYNKLRHEDNIGTQWHSDEDEDLKDEAKEKLY